MSAGLRAWAFLVGSAAGPGLFGAEARQLPEAALTFPGPWQFMVPKSAIILVSDQQLEDLQDPDKEVDLSMSSAPEPHHVAQDLRGGQGAGQPAP